MKLRYSINLCKKCIQDRNTNPNPQTLSLMLILSSYLPFILSKIKCPKICNWSSCSATPLTKTPSFKSFTRLHPNWKILSKKPHITLDLGEKTPIGFINETPKEISTQFDYTNPKLDLINLVSRWHPTKMITCNCCVYAKKGWRWWEYSFHILGFNV